MGPMKMNFENFKWKNEFPKQLGLEKQMKKKWGHLSGFHVFFLSYGP